MRRVHTFCTLSRASLGAFKIRSRFDEWVYMLKTSKVRTEFTAAGIQEAGERLDVLKMTPEEKKEYEWMKYDEMDYKSQLYTAELKGEIRGGRKRNIER